MTVKRIALDHERRNTLLVGEINPYKVSARFALYPEPANSSGGRLCHKIFEMDPIDYVRKFDRINLCVSKWSLPYATNSASEIVAAGGPRVVVLLGSRVCAAFGRAFDPFSVVDDDDRPIIFATIPHPSGANRMWNDADSYKRAAATVRMAERDLERFLGC